MMATPASAACFRNTSRCAAETSVMTGASVNGASSRPSYPTLFTYWQSRGKSQPSKCSLHVANLMVLLSNQPKPQAPSPKPLLRRVHHERPHRVARGRNHVLAAVE